ncbi:hypothetical protein H4Q32_016730 [Labeo rohita]|uniref:Uncharacterized protein n=1 Tax=Labeo rohita TaxID=84645 RepID=A0ABQ8M6V6_LABRO|nr:hypothetical protein H4Q32_016730 [Labeo rohita]
MSGLPTTRGRLLPWISGPLWINPLSCRFGLLDCFLDCLFGFPICPAFGLCSLAIEPHLSLDYSCILLCLYLFAVTEYSATQGSSSFSNRHWPDCLLIEIFCDSVNQPLQSELRRAGPRLSLSCFLDFVLLSMGSLFTVGVAEEERNTASVTEMVDTPNCTHIMAATTTPCHSLVTSQLTSQSHITSQLIYLLQILIDCSSVSQTAIQHGRPTAATGIPKPVLSNPSVPEVIPLSASFTIWGIDFWCVWGVFTTAEVPEPAMSAEGGGSRGCRFSRKTVPTPDPEVAAEAAEPPEEAVSIPDSTEVAAYAAEPPEVTFFTSPLVKVVAPIN